MSAAEVTTWILELTDRARVRPPSRPPGRELTVARATEPGTSERLYRTVGADWAWIDRLGWEPARWAAWEQRAETHVATVAGEEAGYVELGPVEDGSCEIAYFGLLPAFHGRGLGGHLLTFGIRRAFALAPRVWVSTCSLDGPHALANYRARGFEVVATSSSAAGEPPGER